MAGVRLNPEGLQWLAGLCAGSACELLHRAAPSSVVWSGQASAAAVNLVHADVGAAADVLTARMQATADKLRTLATGYLGEDAASAGKLRAVAASMAV